MKKKKIIIAVACILVLWVAIGIVDYSRVNSFERPLFCVCAEPLQDGGSGKLDSGIPLTLRGTLCPTQNSLE